MSRAIKARWTGVLLAVASVWLAGPALAIEFWDERVQIHGFYETRMSFGWEDFDSSNEIDMYGWLHVLNIETEVEIAPDGWGPFDMIAAFARVEVKYDCVWNHACGMLPSVDAFGNNPGNLPHRVQTGSRTRARGLPDHLRPPALLVRGSSAAERRPVRRDGGRPARVQVLRVRLDQRRPLRRERGSRRPARPVPGRPPRAGPERDPLRRQLDRSHHAAPGRRRRRELPVQPHLALPGRELDPEVGHPGRLLEPRADLEHRRLRGRTDRLHAPHREPVPRRELRHRPHLRRRREPRAARVQPRPLERGLQPAARPERHPRRDAAAPPPGRGARHQRHVGEEVGVPGHLRPEPPDAPRAQVRTASTTSTRTSR